MFEYFNNFLFLFSFKFCDLCMLRRHQPYHACIHKSNLLIQWPTIWLPSPIRQPNPGCQYGFISRRTSRMILVKIKGLMIIGCAGGHLTKPSIETSRIQSPEDIRKLLPVWTPQSIQPPGRRLQSEHRQNVSFLLFFATFFSLVKLCVVCSKWRWFRRFHLLLSHIVYFVLGMMIPESPNWFVFLLMFLPLSFFLAPVPTPRQKSGDIFGNVKNDFGVHYIPKFGFRTHLLIIFKIFYKEIFVAHEWDLKF